MSFGSQERLAKRKRVQACCRLARLHLVGSAHLVSLLLACHPFQPGPASLHSLGIDLPKSVEAVGCSSSHPLQDTVNQK